MASHTGLKPFKTSPNMFTNPPVLPSNNPNKGVPRTGHKKGVIPQQLKGIKQGEEQQPPPNIKGHIPNEHKPNGQIANGQIVNGQQPRHGARHKAGEHKVKSVTTPLAPIKGTEQGREHKPQGINQRQFKHMRGGHIHSQHAPIKWIGKPIVSRHMQGTPDKRGIIVGNIALQPPQNGYAHSKARIGKHEPHGTQEVIPIYNWPITFISIRQSVKKLEHNILICVNTTPEIEQGKHGKQDKQKGIKPTITHGL